jgi:uncharacterized radical SAM protein YgiQ
MPFLPASLSDLHDRGWDELDVILVTGDAYVDHPSFGAAVIGRVLEQAGFRVGITAQPDWRATDDFARLGKPRLFFGITAGNLDSMVANYTANKRPRKKDDYAPGGKPGLRPDRAIIVYANRVRETFGDVPIVLGGIEASLRRFAHYDFWDNALRRSILIDSRADMLVFGMGEQQVLEIANRLKDGKALKGIPGTAVVARDAEALNDPVVLPSWEEVKGDKEAFNRAFGLMYEQQDPYRGRVLTQKHDTRYVVQFPPAMPLKPRELDQVFALPYERAWHPSYDAAGGVPGFETVRFSIISHRGCCGECAFCGLGLHQGRIIQSRSRESVLREAKLISERPDFRGTITDVGGPTANLYGARCTRWSKAGACKTRQCLMPGKCRNLELGYAESVQLYQDILALPRVKHVFIESGLRYDLLLGDEAAGYLEQLCACHVSGQLKVAPEHTAEPVLHVMNKPGLAVYEAFEKKFRETNRRLKKDQYLVNYFISGHPGCTLADTLEMSLYLLKRRIHPEQIQDFIPLPLTLSGTMFYTGRHPLTGKEVYVPSTLNERKMQRALIQWRNPKNLSLIREALHTVGKQHLFGEFQKAQRR